MMRVARPRIELIMATTGKLGIGNDENMITGIDYVRGPICHFWGADNWAPDNWAPSSFSIFDNIFDD